MEEIDKLIEEEKRAQKELIKMRKEIKTQEDLFKFIEKCRKDYSCDYGAAPHAIAQASLAVAWYLAIEMGLTGFQGEFVMWEFIKGWEFTDNKCGLAIINYDNMLYPRYASRFHGMSISQDRWSRIQNEAKRLLNEEDACEIVRNHWQAIANGHVPFMCTIREED